MKEQFNKFDKEEVLEEVIEFQEVKHKLGPDLIECIKNIFSILSVPAALNLLFNLIIILLSSNPDVQLFSIDITPVVWVEIKNNKDK